MGLLDTLWDQSAPEHPTEPMDTCGSVGYLYDQQTSMGFLDTLWTWEHPWSSTTPHGIQGYLQVPVLSMGPHSIPPYLIPRYLWEPQAPTGPYNISV